MSEIGRKLIAAVRKAGRPKKVAPGQYKTEMEIA